jgi:site-specific DNA recombinase
MENTPNKYFIYVRKSSEGEERQARSIGDQLAEVREIVKKYGLDVVGSFEESRSAKTKGRPLFNEMLDRIEAGEADGIIAWHPDRLARNAFDGGRIIDLLDDGKILDLKFCSFWFENTPQGKLMLNMAFGQSKYYSDSLSVNIRRGQRQKLNEGVWSFKAPIGYLNEPKLRTIVVDPAKAPLVKMAFELYATGHYTLDRLRDTLTAKGLRSINNRPMVSFRYQYLLRNPFYYGVFVLNGEMHEGAHKPLITKELFDAVQRVMQGRSKQNTVRLKYYVYRGLLRCEECGCGVTMETQKGHNYLHCTTRVKKDCSQRYIREESMSEQIAAVLRSVSFPDDMATRMVQKVEAKRVSAKSVIEPAKRHLVKEIEKADVKLGRLTAAYLDAGAFTADEFRKRKQETINKKRDLTENLAALDRSDVIRFEPVIRFINGSKQMKYVAEEGKPAELRAKLQKVGSNLILGNRRLRWEPRGAWKLVVDQGSFAQHNAAPEISGAAFIGETRLYPTEWRRGELNPRPEMTSMMASTCLADVLISTAATSRRHSSPPSSRLYLVSRPTTESGNQPANCSLRAAGFTQG